MEIIRGNRVMFQVFYFFISFHFFNLFNFSFFEKEISPGNKIVTQKKKFSLRIFEQAIFLEIGIFSPLSFDLFSPKKERKGTSELG